MTRTRGTRTLAVLSGLLASLGCLPPSVVKWPDPSHAEPVARRFQVVAVLPFVGDEEIRRPAEELVALRLRAQEETGVMPPFHVGRALAAAVAAGELTAGWREEVTSWVARSAGWVADPAGDRPAMARTLAAVLGADALLVGSTFTGGVWSRGRYPSPDVHAHLLLVDGVSGEVAALVARRSALQQSVLGRGAAAMDASGRAADAMLGVLAARPGETPSVLAPEPPTWIDDAGGQP